MMSTQQIRLQRLETIDDLEMLYEAQYRAMLRLARLITGSTMLAEEAVQDAFVSTYQRRDAVEKPEPYLRRTVLNNCYSVMRRRSLERDKLQVIGDSDGERLQLPAELDETWDRLAHLNPKQRTALVLRYYEDLSLQSVAEAMDERLGTVKSLIHRALKQLEKELSK